MTWSVRAHDSWASASTDDADELAGGLALPGTWRWHPPGTLLVRADQVPHLPVTEPGPSRRP